mmetsp:Transcript_96946/g.278514  ORF Transcript_96946/g.278514 Transcript_96946/m.278514 type:complete len:238 (+) Transcript_96946:722-1435(+)
MAAAVRPEAKSLAEGRAPTQKLAVLPARHKSPRGAVHGVRLVQIPDGSLARRRQTSRLHSFLVAEGVVGSRLHATDGPIACQVATLRCSTTHTHQAEVAWRRLARPRAMAEENGTAGAAIRRTLWAAVVLEAQASEEELTHLLTFWTRTARGVISCVGQRLHLLSKQEPLLVCLPAGILAVALAHQVKIHRGSRGRQRSGEALQRQQAQQPRPAPHAGKPAHSKWSFHETWTPSRLS